MTLTLILLTLVSLANGYFDIYEPLVSPYEREGPGPSDPGDPLILSDYIEKGRIEEAVEVSVVDGLDHRIGRSKSHSGYFTVDKKYDSNMFFWFFPAMKASVDAPLLLWLDGGPGVPSLVGLFSSVGPLSINESGNVMQRNVTWNTDYHMLFIDNPVGTGFSFTDSSKKGLSKNEDEVADNLYSALIQFFTIFTDYQKCDFYIAGVSYAGKYIPAIGHKIDQENPKAKLKINLVGIALGDALIDPEKMYFEFGEMFYEIGMATRKEADFINYQTNRTIDFIQQKQYLQAFLVFDELLNGNIYPYPPYIFNITGTGNFYNFLLPKPPPTNFLPFLNKDDTRKAIHVGKTELNHGEDVAMALIEDIMQSMAPNFTVLLEKYKVLVYNGQLDIIVGVTRTEGFLNQLKWSGQQGFVKAKKQIWKLNDVLAGYIRKYGNLQQVVVLNAGHHVPYDRPERAYAMMKKFIEDQ